jgi:hypothetical protein
MAIVTALLIDHGETVTPLVDLLEASWPEWYNPRGASARADLAERMQREHLPLGIVAFVDGVLAGTCALAARSGGVVSERGPWLGGLVVDPRCADKAWAVRCWQGRWWRRGGWGTSGSMH